MKINLPARKVRLIGLTGSIAAGKSAACGFLQKLGVPVVDADILARKVVEAGSPALGEIAERFGREVVRADGTLDREALGRVIFADEVERRALEAILHPKIAAEAKKTIKKLLDSHPLVVYCVPLLFETGMEGDFDLVAVISCSREKQLARLMARDSIGAEEAERKISSQIDLRQKVRRADAVLENDGELEALGREVEAFVAEIARHNRN